MGKKVAPASKRPVHKVTAPAFELDTQKHSDFSISEKNYLQFFEFLKELHLTPRQQDLQMAQFQHSLDFITSTIINFFNFAKNYTLRQLECSTICLANLLNVIGSKLSEVVFQRQFVLKLRRFMSELAQGDDQLGYQQKVQAILYILVVLIYKQKMSELRVLKQFLRSLFADRIFLSSLLQLSLPKQKKVSKFYGIVMVYLSNRKNNQQTKKAILKSIHLNFKNIEHETTSLNLLVHLRNQKNKVTINVKDIKDGNMIELLIAAYPRHIQDYQSYYILDYLQHLLSLFPSLAPLINEAKFIPYLLRTAAPTNFHHPLHQSTIIQLIQSTLKYLESLPKELLIQQITQITPLNPFTTIKLVQMLIDFEIQPLQLLGFAYKGYFDRLLEAISREEEEGTRKRAIQLYLKVVDKIKRVNEATASLLLVKLQWRVERLDNPQLLALLPPKPFIAQ